MSAPHFKFVANSKYLDKSEAQEAMMDAIEETSENGIIVAPCGCGKSAVIIEALMKAGTMGLVLCYESQGVYQMADSIRENTTLMDNQLFVYSGKGNNTPDERFCYFVTTYGMFSATCAHRSGRSRAVRDFVLRTKWDLVCCDEFHHACAPTYRPLIEDLVQTSTRVLGFTATLFRSECNSSKDISALHEARAFGWFGRVLFRRRCRELEKVGLIAKIRRAVVHVELTAEFARAHVMAKGAQNIYIAALNPAKLNALKAICTRHSAMGHVGIVFSNHLLVAKVAKRCLGDGWAVLSGGAAHGEDDKHTPERNAEIVRRFNAGKLDGMICTAVGESSMDVNVQSFCYVVLLDGDGGVASAAQRLGRVARSKRICSEEGESDAQLAQRRIAHQKCAVYYDLLTTNTADVEAAATRQHLFATEGYAQEEAISHAKIVGMAVEAGVVLPHTTLVEDMCLLKQILMYGALGGVAADASAAAAAHSEPARQVIKKRKLVAAMATNKLIRERANKQLMGAKKQLGLQLVDSRAIKHRHIKNQSMDELTRRIFRSINLPLSVLTGANLFEDVIFATSDEEASD